MSESFCPYCNRIVKNMWRHLNTNKHISNSRKIKYTTLKKNVMVKDLNFVFSEHKERYKKKFLTFSFVDKFIEYSGIS